jgi:hypothetical protein
LNKWIIFYCDDCETKPFPLDFCDIYVANSRKGINRGLFPIGADLPTSAAFRFPFLDFVGSHFITTLLFPHSSKMEFIANNNADEAVPDPFSLFNLTQKERDDLLSTIVYVNRPKSFRWVPEVDGEMPFEECGVVNYSRFYESLSDQARPKVPNVASLRAGDIVRMGEYRGVGSFYVMWLHQDLVPATNASRELDDELVALPDYENHEDLPDVDVDRYGLTAEQWQQVFALYEVDGWWDDEEFRAQFPVLLADLLADENAYLSRTIKGMSRREGRTFGGWVPTVVPREADGPHNDGLHHCYLFMHPDEMGYAAPSAFSSTPSGYFEREYASAVIDPLLTHSQSENGRLIMQCKLEARWANDQRFPLHYYGDLDCCEPGYEVTTDLINWVRDEQGQQLAFPGNLDDIRQIFTRHFETEWINNYVLK